MPRGDENDENEKEREEAGEGPSEEPFVLFTVSALRLHLPKRLPPTPRERRPLYRTLASSLSRLFEEARSLYARLRDR